MRTPLIALASIALAGSVLVPATAQADPAATAEAPGSAASAPVAPAVTNLIRGATLTWPISQCAFDTALPACSSLTETQSVSGRVTRDDSAGGWVFTGGRGVYDTVNNATTMQWNGSVTIGNTTRGNYAITFAGLMVSIDGEGNGELIADVTYRIRGAVPVTKVDVTVVSFTPTTPGYDMVVTPEAFDEMFLSELNPELRGWFEPTGTSLDPLKVPGTVSMGFAAWQPRLTVTIPGGEKPRVNAKAFTVVIRGTGFDPAARLNPSVQGIYVNFGPNPATIESGYTDPGIYYVTKYLAASPDENGNFTVRLKVKGRYRTESGSFNALTQPLGISTWAAHARTTTAYDAFTRIAFRR